MDNDDLYNSPYVANRIKACAKQKNISLTQILQDCSLGANTFSHMLHGRALAFDSLAKIADYLDCSVDYLLGREKADAEEISAEENVIIYHRDGKTVKKKMSKEKMELLATMLEALPDDGEL